MSKIIDLLNYKKKPQQITNSFIFDAMDGSPALRIDMLTKEMWIGEELVGSKPEFAECLERWAAKDNERYKDYKKSMNALLVSIDTDDNSVLPALWADANGDIYLKDKLVGNDLKLKEEIKRLILNQKRS
tara:strand:+ start:70 stop:459 length:390 start_codon:yes stop_codon:yes gene_type:complete